MTANALADDRERCLQAGMDDFLAKPVVPEQLFDMLWRWIPAHLAGAFDQGPGAPSDRVQRDLTDDAVRGLLAAVEGLDLSVGLRSALGKLPVYRRLLKLFVTSRADDARLMRAALDDGQLAQLRELAHTFKGSAATMGFTLLSELAAQIELPIKDGAADAANAVRPALAQLEKALPATLSKVAGVIAP